MHGVSKFLQTGICDDDKDRSHRYYLKVKYYSACLFDLNPLCCTVLPSDVIKAANCIGDCTESCGTPYKCDTGPEQWVPTVTVVMLQTYSLTDKKERNQLRTRDYNYCILSCDH